MTDVTFIVRPSKFADCKQPDRGIVARPSPQTERIKQIVDLLASNPRSSFHLAEIARHLNISKAGLHPTLIALAEAGWLVRHPTSKAYRLGPALVSIGKAASVSVPSERAVPAMQQLASTTGCTCLALVPSANGLVMTEIVGPSGPVADWMGLRRGHLTRIGAPTGIALFLKADDDAVEEWLYNSILRNQEEARKRFLPPLLTSRERGYTVELRLPMHDTYFLAQRLAGGQRSELEDLLQSSTRLAVDQLKNHVYLLGEIENDKKYQVLAVNAPVYSSTFDVEMILAATSIPGPITGREIKQLGERVLTVAEEIRSATTTALV